MPVNTELTRPESEEDFEAMCCMLYQRVFGDAGLMRVGRTGQSQFGVDLLGVDRRTPRELSVGVQCKAYRATKFTLLTVTADVAAADKAALKIDHLMFATIAPASADVVRQVHELSLRRQAEGKFTVSVEYWNTIQAHLRMHPEVGRAFIPGFPGNPLLSLTDQVVGLRTESGEHFANADDRIEGLTRDVAVVSQRLEHLTVAVSQRTQSFSPDSRGDEADPGIVVSLDFIRDRLREGKTRDAQKLLSKLGDPEGFRDLYSRFRYLTNLAAVDLLEGRPTEAAQGFLKAFALARDDEKGNINRVHAYYLQEKYEAAEVACEEALIQFPGSAALWGMRLHIRSKLAKPPDDGAAPAEIREQSDYQFALARIHSDSGDHATAVALLQRSIAGDGGSLDARRSYLAAALMWAGVESVATYLGQMPNDRRVTLEDALGRLEPLEETLATIQSSWLSEELATNVTSSLMVLGFRDRARAIAAQLLGRHPDLDQLLRVRLAELAEKKDSAALKALTVNRLATLPPAALSLLAEASARNGDIEWHAQIQVAAARRVAEDVRLEAIAPLSAVAVWRRGDRVSALEQAQAFVTSHPAHLVGRVILSQMLEDTGKVNDAKREARASAARIPPGFTGADVLMVADRLGQLDLYAEAAPLYERFVVAPRADELTNKWLTCLICSDQRKKALATLNRLPPEDRAQREIRHIEVTLAARMMDWPRMRALLEPDIEERPLRGDVALSYGSALFRLNEGDRLRKFAASDPRLKDATLEQELEFSKLQVAAGLPELGLHRLFKLFKRHPNNSEVAGNLLAQVMVTEPIDEMLRPPRVGPGCAVEVVAATETWWTAIDHDGAEPVESWPELVQSNSPTAKELMGADVGTRLTITRGLLQAEAEVTRVLTLFSYSLEKAQALIAATPNSPGPVWSVPLDEDGRIDADALIEQSRRRRDRVEAAFSLYQQKSMPIGMLAWFIGSDPVSLQMEWPGDLASCFIGFGTEDERQASLRAIRRPDQRFVTDLFTLAELLSHGVEASVLAMVGRPLVPESQRQLLLEVMRDDLRVRRRGVLQEHNGRLRLVELTPAYLRHRQRFTQKLLTFLDEECHVVATAGPEDQGRELRKLMGILDAPSADCVLLCLERDAALLCEDGALRMLATQVGVAATSSLQPVWLEAAQTGRMNPAEYALCLAVKLRRNHDFVSVSGPNLMELASQTPAKVNPAVRTALETFRRPTLALFSGVKVCADFLRLAMDRLPPATVGQYARLAVDVLAHTRSEVSTRELERVFGSRMTGYGRNGRRLPAHVRRVFGRMVSRRRRMRTA